MSKEARTLIIIMITFLIILIDMCNHQQPEDQKKEMKKDSTELKKSLAIIIFDHQLIFSPI